MKKQIVCFFIAALLVIGSMPASAENAEPEIRQLLVLDNVILVLRADGRVIPACLEDDEDGYGELEMQKEALDAVAEWKDIIELANCNSLVAGLKKDGTVVTVRIGDYNVPEKTETDDWTDVVSLEGGYSFIGGLREDGTVLTVGSEPMIYPDELSFFDELADWTDVVKLDIGVCSAGEYAVGLRSDGTAVYEGIYDVGWTGPDNHITDIACSGWMLIAVREDGRVVANGEDSWSFAKTINDWRDVRQAVCGDTEAIVLHNNGTISATNSSRNKLEELKNVERIELVMYRYFAAYQKNGSVYIESYVPDELTQLSRTWTDIVQIYTSQPYGGQCFLLGLRTDGTVVSAGIDFNSLYREALKSV